MLLNMLQNRNMLATYWATFISIYFQCFAPDFYASTCWQCVSAETFWATCLIVKLRPNTWTDTNQKNKNSFKIRTTPSFYITNGSSLCGHSCSLGKMRLKGNFFSTKKCFIIEINVKCIIKSLIARKNPFTHLIS